MIQRRKKFLFAILAFAVLFLTITQLSGISYARELENDYPKIPLLNFGGTHSLNDIWNRDPKGPFATLDPLAGLIFYVFSLLIMLSGLVAFGMLVYAGVMFMLSGVNPTLRAQAKKKLQSVLIGIALLLGSVIILNTINPELKILTISKHDWVQNLDFFTLPQRAGSDSVDLGSLKYGGVVLFSGTQTDGAGGLTSDMSETLLNNISSFSEGTYIAEDSKRSPQKLKAIKILGNCTVDAPEIAKSWIGPTGPIHPTGDWDVKSLKFQSRDCLGHSITAYSDLDFKEHTKIFLASRANFKGDELSGHKKIPFARTEFDLDNNILSIKFALENISKTFNATFCNNPLGGNTQSDCASSPFTTDITKLPQNLLTERGSSLVSSIVLGGDGTNRQAGVILYDEKNFEGKSETLIAEDRNLFPNFIGRNTISSLMIIGKYKVTLYHEVPDSGDPAKKWDPKPGEQTLIFDNTGDSLTVTNSFPDISNERKEPIPTRQNGIIKIPDLTKYWPKSDTNWNDTVDAIRIQVPKTINDAQNLGGICTDLKSPDLCDL